MSTAALDLIGGPESDQLPEFGSGLRERLGVLPTLAGRLPGPVTNLGVISPELVLVDAELAKAARELLPEPGALARIRTCADVQWMVDHPDGASLGTHATVGRRRRARLHAGAALYVAVLTSALWLGFVHPHAAVGRMPVPASPVADSSRH